MILPTKSGSASKASKSILSIKTFLVLPAFSENILLGKNFFNPKKNPVAKSKIRKD
jgi:hypothetical protein